MPIYHTDIKEVISTEEESPDANCDKLEKIVEFFNRTVFREGVRNLALFIASIAIRSQGVVSFDSAWRRLYRGIRLNTRSDFTETEIQWTIRSGLGYDDGFLFSPRTLEHVGYPV